MQKIDTLIRNGIVVTVDAERRILEDGALALHRGRIAAVGKTADLVAKYDAEEVIDASRMIILPGRIQEAVEESKILGALRQQANIVYSLLAGALRQEANFYCPRSSDRWA